MMAIAFSGSDTLSSQAFHSEWGYLSLSVAGLSSFIAVIPSGWDIISSCQSGIRQPDILIYPQLFPSLGFSISSGDLPHVVNSLLYFVGGI